METHRGKSVPVVQDFQVAGSWAPVTPVKPNLARPPIYDDGHGGLLTEAWNAEEYLSRFTQQNQAQTLLSYSISTAEKSSIPGTSNTIWDTAHGNHSLPGRMQMQGDNGDVQRRGLEEYLPRWTSQGRRSMAVYGSANLASSNYPNSSSWASQFPLNNNGLRGNGSIFEHNSTDPFAQYSDMPFGDLLATGDTMRLGDNIGVSDNDAFLLRFATQPNASRMTGSMMNSHEALMGADQTTTGIYAHGMHNGAFPHPYLSVSNGNSTPRTEHANGKHSTFAPATPNSQQRIESNVASGHTYHGANQGTNELNAFREHEVAAAMVNLQDHQNEEVTGPITESSPGKESMALEENPNPDKEGQDIIDLNQTPQKKPRRRRYQPKVVTENKPKRTPKPKTPKPTDKKETQVKRKYVRKNKTDTPPTTSPEETTEAGETKPTEPDGKSCRRSLNFDLNGQATEHSSYHVSDGGSYGEPPANECPTAGNQSSHPAHFRQGEEMMVDTSKLGTAYDLNRTLTQELKDYISLPETHVINSSQPDTSILSKGKERGPRSPSRYDADISSRTDNHLAQSPNSSPCASSNERVQTRGSKRSHSCIVSPTDVDAGNEAATHSTLWQANHTFLGNTSIQTLFPEICKKKRTEKGQRSHTSSTPSSGAASEGVADTENQPRVDPSASKYYYFPFGVGVVTNNQPQVVAGSSENKMPLLNTWPDIARLKKKKRSKGATRARALAPITGTASVLPVSSAAKGPHSKMTDISNNLYPSTAALNGEYSCKEALAVDTTPKSKRRSRKQDSQNEQWALVKYNDNRAIRKATGPKKAQPREKKPTIAELTKRLERLDINFVDRKPSRKKQNALVCYRAPNQEQNALVPYVKDGTMVPFEGPFDPVKKRRQRAKVELDDETTRVWRLLLENIDNQGIDGTDEDKARWWENERSVFRGRVDSFIARMRLVQGDRRFTPWKGSVLDSVVGVFLTQNVSDHLSSSAFMSLAARFPLKPESSGSTLSEEATSPFVVEPEICIIEPEESITWIEKTMDQPIMEGNSRIVQDTDHSEEKEVVNSKEGRPAGSVSPKDYSSETCPKAPNDSLVNNGNSQTTETGTASMIGDDRARDDATSSQQSVMSSQNSINSPNLQTVGMTSIFSESDSRTQALTNSLQCNYFDGSFLGLLKMAETPLLQEPYSQAHLHDQPECMKHVEKYSSETPGVFSSDYQLNLRAEFQLRDTKGVEIPEVESRSSDMSRKDENSPTTEQSNLTTESTVQHLVEEKTSNSNPRSAENMCSWYVLEGEKMVVQSQRQSVREPLDTAASSGHGETSSTWKGIHLPNSSQQMADVTESTRALERAKSNHKEINQFTEQNHTSGGITDMANVNPSKTTRGKAGKGKNNEYDWDSLRKQAQVDGKKREKTANTRDSLDWEAVRLAHVSEIAETIKERGMNNMLAERIKDLLDRLLREHGSIDLEWLRDIPPDKAKEYLLSFRGLGLKSVECVRLLTLHHLAFPVDTNVGRIAVRLGWVPLQPLPESLQLHLLELYPVLESIQKYLWPRLCKLDQKTLYELHYHMITFGKVFCTKRQPNCNACPLRGECRHFASAFASARFSLPGPEERSIMPSGGSRTSHADPDTGIKLLPSPPSWSNYPQSNSKYTHDAHGLQTPTMSLPLSQTVHLERKSINSVCEPIVEVPASPEPEQQEQVICDIEDAFYEDPDDIPTIKLNMKEFTQTLQNFMHANRDLQEAGMSNAMVALTAEAASIPTPKLKNISRLRTEHHVYELPDTHPLLKGLDKREPDDPCSYLLAIWTPGETPDSIQPPARRCSSDDPSILCNEETCSYCSSQREVNSQIVRGTLLIPCRTAMRGSFPLNGTYFQVNEVFADHESSLNPIAVPRSWLWNLPRRTVYFGTSIPTIFRGLTTEDIQHCFWRGYVCVRGFDQERRAPRPLMARLHFPASKMTRGPKGKVYDE